MKRLFIAIIALWINSSCSPYQKALKSEEVKVKYELAEKLYQEKDYKRANRLYDQIHKDYIGKPQGERILYFYANTHFELEKYQLAAYEYERFYRAYPKSDKVVEAMFMGAKSLYMESPKYTIDQTETKEAIEKLQVFINTYPDSPFLSEANAMAKELTNKLEYKALDISKQYLKLGGYRLVNYRAAVASFNNFIADYPGSDYREEALFYRFEASYELAKVSIQSVLQERLETAQEYYDAFVRYFPESKFRKKADKNISDINKRLQQFSK
ncbi:MAG: outer membrane protein assembly factor BamD [Flavobacteriaceae bacterium]|nr:outer membrane protein assembly factor BamD [Flavobacteriaceae bacterium]